MSPDRYGDETPAVVDFDSRRRVREAEVAIKRAREQRERLAETRTVHAPMSSEQADAGRRHRRAVTDRAEGRRNKLRINNCQLCDEDGYTPRHVVCDHRDHRPAAKRGMAAVRAAMGWPGTPTPTDSPENPGDGA
ncbi:hypothetical protein [Mycolicibacterium fortuitum]|uniref:Uncharacterized protein n=1 Tax=Mycolicibacterium fortuitum TaxID=1766 RepID=A0AAE5AFA5_MYCFO|nr:hypothetical protein [Mycolicibacterium fortuitum]MDV7194783.1 hypothetical protein [Mycolicibacterium fortuitum]MDV7207686.1 hypothetical protein [Mycolicibacterium fortuitum]MDV7229742.1 hypothetical protein [Mycolicibacterium fortuitum]MDV7261505.1 hypothetical protein [Mycolicibacterium fortuitum]MDV7286715.1 hypothetical protein [Mycolicibacterium fortuitum]